MTHPPEYYTGTVRALRLGKHMLKPITAFEMWCVVSGETHRSCSIVL